MAREGVGERAAQAGGLGVGVPVRLAVESDQVAAGQRDEAESKRGQSVLQVREDAKVEDLQALAAVDEDQADLAEHVCAVRGGAQPNGVLPRARARRRVARP